MALKGKHLVTEIAGIRCSVVESGLTEDRKKFLEDLLVGNGFQVRSEEEKDKEGKALGTFVLGVTDILFNPVIALYQRKLFRNDGKEVTPAWWEQKSKDTDIPYWQVRPAHENG
jgi:hypothetical protein